MISSYHMFAFKFNFKFTISTALFKYSEFFPVPIKKILSYTYVHKLSTNVDGFCYAYIVFLFILI